MVSKDDHFTLSLPLQFAEIPTPRPAYRAPSAPRPAHPYLDWRQYHQEEAWIARWQQDGALLTAKIEAVEIVNPQDAAPHLWRHCVTVHAFINGEEVAVAEHSIEAPLADLDLLPVMDDVVYDCGAACLKVANGDRQQSLLH